MARKRCTSMEQCKISASSSPGTCFNNPSSIYVPSPAEAATAAQTEPAPRANFAKPLATALYREVQLAPNLLHIDSLASEGECCGATSRGWPADNWANGAQKVIAGLPRIARRRLMAVDITRTQSWRPSKTPGLETTPAALLFKKRNLIARMAPRERWRCANHNRHSDWPASLGDASPSSRLLISMMVRRDDRPNKPQQPWNLDATVKRRAPDDEFASCADDAFILLTSDSTSRPKTVPLTHASVCVACAAKNYGRWKW